MSDFHWALEIGQPEETKARLLEIKVGDGLEQSMPDGLNHLERTWKWSTAPVSITVKDAILAFLRTKGGYIAFTWTPNGGTEKIVRCKAWTNNPPSDAYNRYVISGEFNEFFGMIF